MERDSLGRSGVCSLSVNGRAEDRRSRGDFRTHRGNLMLAGALGRDHQASLSWADMCLGASGMV